MALLEIALQLSKYKLKNAVRFAFWTAEEVGLVGSTYYVTNLPEAERQKIGVYLNFDMIASPNGGHFIYDGDGSVFNLTGPTGSDRIEKLFQDYFVKVNVKSGSAAFSGSSDYGPFLDVGIPSGGVNTGAGGIKTAEQVSWCVRSSAPRNYLTFTTMQVGWRSWYSIRQVLPPGVRWN